MNLTKKQKQILDLERISDNSINVICGSVLIDKKPDIQAMTRAANELFRVNDALRIKIVHQNGTDSQIIEDFKEKNIEVVWFSEKSELHKYAQNQASIPLDINGALCEIKILAAENFSGILYKLHHIISDAWTLSLLASQFNKIMNGEEVVAYSYKDHIEVDTKYFLGNRCIKDQLFYIEQFKKQPEPIFISEKPVKTDCAKRKSFYFDIELNLLKQFLDKNKISPATFFLSILSACYSRLNNYAEKFYIGMPIVNRTGPVEKSTAGLFINTAPVLIELNSEATFLENVTKIEELLVSAMRHQKYTYEDILTDLNDKFGYTGKLFDLIFSYQNAQIYGDSFESTWYHNGTQKESLQIHIDDRDSTGSFTFHYDYQVEKFSEKDIEILHKHICTLFSEVLETPDKKICDLEMLISDEKQKLLCDFNNTLHKYCVPDDSTLYSLFEETAKETPDKICIKTAEKKMSFSELLNISRKLDAELRSLTNSKKSVIAVIAERSVEMYAAIYGIIRGGNAYLPIDPMYPQERIDYILKNSEAAAVVTQGRFAHLAGKTPCIDMSEFINSLSEEFVDTPTCAAKSDDTAYIIYTSGSTGNPKGAKVSHKSAVNRILWMHDKYRLGSDDVILQKTPYTFDVSVWELFWWGMCGGSLAVSKPGEHFLPAKILHEIYNNKVTHLHFVPSVFELLLNYMETHKEELHKFNSVKYVFLSGEALAASLVQRFYKLFDYNKVTVHNLYGPTECAVDVTYYDCKPTDIDPIPIGKPIYNTQMYVVDKCTKLVPIGVTGELCIAGTNVGQGYLNKPELTAEKFIDNPFGEGKLYKTGDLAYWREDGNIIFCGRKDGQIKLNGQRIEIGEIEAVISSVDDVDSAAIVVRKVNDRDTLVVFYTGKKDSEVLIKEVSSSRLPQYMVPNIIIHVDKLPLNQSGKLDRKALAQKEIATVQPAENNAPINDSERFICEAFKITLGEKNIGRNSDFFECGGTSLSMISLLSEKGFENITAAEFMRNATPAKLALIIKAKKKNSFKYLEPLYIPTNPKQALILLPFAGGGAESYSNFVNSLKRANDNTSVYFIHYLHSTEECKKAAVEIANILGDTDILMYSHCVGSALALQILDFLETEKVTVKHYISGASIPPAKPTKKNVWNAVPDGVLKYILSKAGAKFDQLSDDNLNDVLKQFRKDTDFANISFAEFGGRIKVPVSLIINKNDIFTRNYKQAEILWKKYAETINEVRFIDSESHYFQSDNSEELTSIILALRTK